MSKYDPLGAYLRAQKHALIPMTFREIEQLLHISLPRSKIYPAWWSNNPDNNPMTRQWLESGYKTEAVDIAGERLVFRRSDMSTATQQESAKPASEKEIRSSASHPIFGCMKGTVTIEGGYDLTQPADPDWGKVYEDG